MVHVLEVLILLIWKIRELSIMTVGQNEIFVDSKNVHAPPPLEHIEIVCGLMVCVPLYY